MTSTGSNNRIEESAFLQTLGVHPILADETAGLLDTNRELACQVAEGLSLPRQDHEVVVTGLIELMDSDTAPDPGTPDFADRALLVRRKAIALGVSVVI